MSHITSQLLFCKGNAEWMLPMFTLEQSTKDQQSKSKSCNSMFRGKEPTCAFHSITLPDSYPNILGSPRHPRLYLLSFPQWPLLSYTQYLFATCLASVGFLDCHGRCYVAMEEACFLASLDSKSKARWTKLLREAGDRCVCSE